MKKIVRLTERDLTRLVKRVIKEQQFEDGQDYGDNLKNMSGKAVLLEDADSRQVQRALNKLSKNVMFITITNCENADFSQINLCDFPELKFLNLKGTPNNLEETQDDCYEQLNSINGETHPMYEFNAHIK